MLARRVRGDVGQRLVLDDAPARQVLVLRLQLAPAGERFQPSEHIGLAAVDADALPHLIEIDTVIVGIADPFHFLVQPQPAPGLAELFEHLGENPGQMGDVGDRIVDLARVERTPGPVGKARALVDDDPEIAFDEVRIAHLFALTQRHRRNLGIEHRMRGLAGQVVDDFQILPAGMDDLQHILILGQQVEQGFQVDARRHRVDRGGFVRVGDLDQAQFGPIAVLAHEFGVDRDEIGGGQAGAQLGEAFRVLDQRMNLHRAPITRPRALTKRLVQRIRAGQLFVEASCQRKLASHASSSIHAA